MRKTANRVTAFLLSTTLAFQNIFTVDIPFVKNFISLLAVAEGDESDNGYASAEGPSKTNGDIENIKPDQDPTGSDGISIEYVHVQWLTGSEREEDEGNGAAEYGTLYLEPLTENLTDQQFQIDFFLTGQESFAPGEVRIAIPAYIWDAPNNVLPTLSFPMADDESAEFNWYVEGDQIIIKNTKTLSSSTKVMLQGTYQGVDATEIPDESFSYDFYADVTVEKENKDPVKKESNHINSFVDTDVWIKPGSVTKSAYDSVTKTDSVYWYEPPADLPQEFLDVLPGNSSDYVYVRWFVTATAEGSQKFKMYVEDSSQDGSFVLGVTKCAEGNAPSQNNGESVKARLFGGEDDTDTELEEGFDYSTLTQTAYVWTAYPASLFERSDDGSAVPKELKNTANITIDGEYDSSGFDHADASVNTKLPTTYEVVKEWDDEGYEDNRPPSVDVEIRDGNNNNSLIDSPNLKEENEWSYRWTDNGKGADYNVKEKALDEKNEGTRYDENGNKYDKVSGYKTSYSDRVYDPETKSYKYIITNKYVDNWIGAGGDNSIASLKKNTTSAFSDGNPESMRDSLSLNRLQHKEAVTVPFTVTDALVSNVKDYVTRKKDGNSEPALFEVADDLFVFADKDNVNDLNQNTDNLDIEVTSVTIPIPRAYGFNIEDSDQIINVDENGNEEIKAAESWEAVALDGSKISPLVLYGKAEGKNEYIILAKLEYKEESGWNFGEINGDYIKEAANSTRKVVFKDNAGIVGIKLQVKADAAFVDFKGTAKEGIGIDIRINPTQTICDLITRANSSDSDYTALDLINKARSCVNDNTQREASSNAHLHGRDYKIAANLNKTLSIKENNGPSDRVVFTSRLEMTQQSNVAEIDEFLQAADRGEVPYSKSGIYYDLLPDGADFDISSIRLGNGDSLIGVDFQRNYKGSGRTLVAIEVAFNDNLVKTQKGIGDLKGVLSTHTLEFDFVVLKTTIYTENLHKKDYINVAAFETDNPDGIGSYEDWKGAPDDPSNINDPAHSDYHKGYAGRFAELTQSGANQTRGDSINELMKYLDGLDPAGGQSDSFVYAVDLIAKMNVLFSEVLGITKQVSTPASDIYTRSVNVQEGGYYTYRLLVISESNTETSDIFLFDILENYVPRDDDDDFLNGNYQYRWKGTLKNIEIVYNYEYENEEELACPVVYYYTGDPRNLDDFSNTPNAQDIIRKQKEMIQGEGWASMKLDEFQTAMKDERLPNITAIAIDLSTKADESSPFTLSDGQSISAYIHMKAPYTEDPFYDSKEAFDDANGEKYLYGDGCDPDLNAHAFNKGYICYKTKSKGSSTDGDDAIASPVYTSVGIHTNKLTAEKIWDDDNDRDGLRPNEIKIILLRKNDAGFKREGVLTEDNGWKYVFTRLDSYDEIGNPYSYYCVEEFDDNDKNKDGKDDYTLVSNISYDSNKNITIKLKNIHVPEKIEIPVEKEWIDQGNMYSTRPESVTFILKSTNDPSFAEQTLTVTAADNWKGKFTDLNKYVKIDGETVPAEYIIEEAYVKDYVLTNPKNVKNPDGSYTFINEYSPYGDIIITKKVNGNTDASLNNTFSFHFFLEPPEGEEGIISGSYHYKIFNNLQEFEAYENSEPTEDEINGWPMIMNGETFTLGDGCYIVIKNVNTGLVYTITEQSLTGTGYTLTNKVNDTGNVSSWKPAEVEFVNTYETKGTVNITAKKNLSGRPLTGYQFRFELYQKNDNTDEYELFKTATNSADGSVSFGVSYGNDDHNKTYEYILREIANENQDYYTFDETRYKIVVEVTDNGNGTMNCDVTYSRFNADTDSWEPLDDEQLEFNNIYEASGTITLRAWKKIDGRALEKDDIFRFDLYGKDENGVFCRLNEEAVTNDGNVIEFNIDYTEKDIGKTYWYFVREENLADDNTQFIYTNAIVGYKVTVIDNGDGNLSFDQRSYIMTDAFAECGMCHGRGIIESTGVECASCGGFGYLPGNCSTCSGNGVDSEGNTCEACSGTGYNVILCSTCKGSCVDGEGNACADCGGTGRNWHEPSTSDVPLFINSLKGGSLSVEKIITFEKEDEDNIPEDAEFPFYVKFVGEKPLDAVITFIVVNSDGSSVDGGSFNITESEYTYSFTLKAGQKITFSDVPAGATYQVWEDTPDDWVLDESENASGSIVSMKESKAIFTNLYQKGITTAIIVGAKYLDNKPAGADALGNPFSFELIETDENGNPVLDGNGKYIYSQTVEADENGLIRFEAIRYEDATGSPHYYKIREIPGDNTDIQYDDHEETVIVTVTKNGESLSSSTRYENGSSMLFENKTLPGALEIYKFAKGLTEANKNAEFTFDITFYNELGIPVSDNIIWYIVDEDGSMIAPDGTVINPGDTAAPPEESDDSEEPDDTDDEDESDTDETVSLETDAVKPLPKPVGKSISDAVRALAVDKLKAAADAIPAEDYASSQAPTLDYVKELAADSDNVVRTVPVYNAQMRVIKTGRTVILPYDGTEVPEYVLLLEKGVNGDMGGWTSNPPGFHNETYTNNNKTVDGLGDYKKMITAIVVDNDNVRTSTDESRIFMGFENLVYADLTNLDISRTTGGMIYFLANCYNLIKVKFNSQGVCGSDMSHFFENCYSLKTLENFRVNRVNHTTNSHIILTDMFKYCKQLSEVEFIGWNFGNCAYVRTSTMFSRCTNLTSVNISNWKMTITNNGNIDNFSADMFQFCSSLQFADVSKWQINFGSDTSELNMQLMFGSGGLDAAPTYKTLDISGWEITGSGKIKMTRTFEFCPNLENIIGIETFVTSRVTNLNAAFRRCNSLTSLDLGKWNTSNVTDMQQLFYACNALEYLDLSGWNTKNVTSYSEIFNGCNKLSKVTLTSSFYDNGITNFPLLPTSTANPYTGTWIQLEDTHDDNKVYSSEELRSNKDSKGKTILFTDSPLTFVWHKLSYKISFSPGPEDDENDYSGSMSSPNIWISVDEAYTLPKNQYTAIDKDGEQMIFVGWKYGNKEFPDDGNGVAVIPANSFNSNTLKECGTITLIAMWKSVSQVKMVEFKVEHWKQDRFDKNEYVLADTTTYKRPADTSILINPIEYEDFIIPYSEAVTIKVTESIEGKTVKQFKYDHIRYTIKFYGNGDDVTGSTPDLEMVVPFGDYAENCFTKEASIFMGWNTEPDGSGESFGVGAPINITWATDGDVIALYAQWFSLADAAQEPSNGTITVRCKAGQKIVIPDLPAGTIYTVTESNIPNGWSFLYFIDETGEKVEAEPANGNILANITSKVSATNEYNAVGYATINAYKALTDGNVSDYRFEFMLSGTSAPPQIYHTENYTDNGAFDNDSIEVEDMEDIITFPGAKRLHAVISYNTGETGMVYVYDSEEALFKTLSGADEESIDIDSDTMRISAKANNGSHADYYVTVYAEYELTANNTNVTDPNESTSEGVNPWYGTASVTFDTIKFTHTGTYIFKMTEIQLTGDEFDDIVFDVSEFTVVVNVTDNGDGNLNTDVHYYNSDGEELKGVKFTNTKKQYALLTVKQTGEDGYESYIYRVKNVETGEELIVSVTRGGSTTIVVPVGNYIVEEISEWSWRYEDGEPQSSDTVSVFTDEATGKQYSKAYVGPDGETFPFSNNRNDKIWLGDENYINNHYGAVS